ncbi:hypothetical protein E3O21_03005 [Cryobacterium flavum]|nr:hypothetical protein [Cryobacterium flavum]TFB81424.1 hypothetical protein E3O21_03005 [Cryobacterium flavum]
MAETLLSPPTFASQRRLIDTSMIEALVLGGICTIGILLVSPVLASSLETNLTTLILTAAIVVPYFLFARAQGLLQGKGDSRSVVWWSTSAQMTQLLLAAGALALGYGATGILVVYLVTVVLGTVGSTFQAKSLFIPKTRKPFSVNSSIVLMLTITFAWLTNVDVILVRSGTSELVAGSFAAAAVLVKTTLILPATLSLYLLPKFVNRRDDAKMTKFGVNATLGITFLSGVTMFILVLLAGDFLVSVLFGAEYDLSVTYLPGMALMWLPWAMSLALLMRITAAASKSGLVVLLLVAATQWIGASVLLPDVFAMMFFNGLVGTATLAVLFTIHILTARSAESAAVARALEKNPPIR